MTHVKQILKVVGCRHPNVVLKVKSLAHVLAR